MPNLTVNIDATTDFLVGLLNTPSPTGFAGDAIEYTRAAFAALNLPNLSMTVTPKGALVATWQSESDVAAVGVTAHVDTLGLMVKEIKPNGRLKLTALGGIPWNTVETEGVTVRTHDGRSYRGSVLLNNASGHVNSSLTKAERNPDSMEVRLDALTRSADQTRLLGIEVGDPVFLDPRVEVGEAGFIRSRHLDDKAGVACVYAALLALKDAGLQPAQTTILHIANYEEVGHGGASGLPHDLAELLTIDMGAVGDGQNSDEFSVCLCIKDSSGPYHVEINRKLRRLAEEAGIPIKPDIYPYYASDGSAYWRAGGDARVGLIGPGIDASHGYERTHKDSIKHTAHLIGLYLLETVG